MSGVDDGASPVQLGTAIISLLEHSDAMDAQLRLRLAAFREGYAAGHQAGYDRGYDDGIMERKRTQQDMLDQLKVHARRWELRGEPRARETFALPHPGDYPGQAG